MTEIKDFLDGIERIIHLPDSRVYVMALFNKGRWCAYIGDISHITESSFEGTILDKTIASAFFPNLRQKNYVDKLEELGYMTPLSITQQNNRQWSTYALRSER